MQFRARPSRILALLVLIAVSNVFVFANGIAGAGKNVLLGKLITNSNRPVLVNGGDAITGTIILSGAELVTSAAGGATVQLEKLGTVMVAPSSNVTLTFDLKNVVVNISSGYAAVTTVEGVKGTVFGADGTPVGGGSNVPAPQGGGGNDNLAWGGIALGGVGIILAIIGWQKAGDAKDDAAAAAAAAAAQAAALAALRTCLAGQTASPVKVCTAF